MAVLTGCSGGGLVGCVVIGDFVPGGAVAVSPGQGEVGFGAGEDDEVNAAVLGASGGGVVGSDGMVLGVSGG